MHPAPDMSPHMRRAFNGVCIAALVFGAAYLVVLYLTFGVGS